MLLRKMRRCGAWSRYSGHDVGAARKRARSPLNLGYAKVLLMIKMGLYRLLTSCGTVVGVAAANERRQDSYR
jgi:hypothetical protein